ncbi:hypothetical protein [Nostoc sp. WHI]|uniref:hypothetical protein n=1 Tax=Nostoc sp. WHI TaxID=2650611 RepID=UPI0018C54846|nr:hypothetical protein [Nostoc sp. WHI]
MPICNASEAVSWSPVPVKIIISFWHSGDRGQFHQRHLGTADALCLCGYPNRIHQLFIGRLVVQ